MTRYFYHPESDSLFTRETDLPATDGLVEEIDEELFYEIQRRQAPMSEVTTAPYEGPNAVQLVKIGRKIKAARSKLAAEFKKADDELKADLQQVEALMLAFLNSTGQKTANTGEHGLFYWQDKIIPRADDWDAFYKWVARNHTFDALQKRIKVTFIADYMEEHKNDKDEDGNPLSNLPPGVSVIREREIVIKNPNE